VGHAAGDEPTGPGCILLAPTSSVVVIGCLGRDGRLTLFSPRRGVRWAAPSAAGNACRLAIAVMLLTVVAACGGSSPHTPSHSSIPASATTSPTTSPSLTPGTVNRAYCGTEDATIPGAANALAKGISSLPNLTPVQQAWFAMDATMVPACSEIIAHPPAVTAKDFTNGQLSDAALHTWVAEFQEYWALVEWGQEHGQAAFLQFLSAGSSDNAVAFVRDGGRIVTTAACEYIEKVDAITASSAQMSVLTNKTMTDAGTVYVDASLGPCSSTWTSANGVRTVHTIAAGQTGWEVDITAARSNVVLGHYLVLPNSWPEGTSGTADSLISEAAGLG
jgi:hypothetical protein